MANRSTPTNRFSGTLQARHDPDTRSVPSIVSLQRYCTRKKTSRNKGGYTCTLCWRNFEKPCFTVGSNSRIVCAECWRWMYDLSVCWACGEIVFRKEDAVRFGWCWWHWGCFSCIICSVSAWASSGQSFANVTGASATSFIFRFLWEAPRRRHKPA
jgi:hypothetical protein